ERPCRHPTPGADGDSIPIASLISTDPGSGGRRTRLPRGPDLDRLARRLAPHQERPALRREERRPDLEHPVAVRGLDGLCVGTRGEQDLSLEGPVGDLAVEIPPLALRLVAVRPARAPDRENLSLNARLELLGIEPGEIRSDHELVALDAALDRRMDPRGPGNPSQRLAKRPREEICQLPRAATELADRGSALRVRHALSSSGRSLPPSGRP